MTEQAILEKAELKRVKQENEEMRRKALRLVDESLELVNSIQSRMERSAA
ncbi:MAG: hypothetical protein JRN26_04385 [Nitrososphaerota archaeon]|jgi:hypothetical protein|nr:hypothetical protein [Nitrososphaerota archaeon]MDG6932527.1 hypothetical protein [Nitrososphaerota archaeon]MDG6936102.1 hypothetical protein [Nitrososphaerota archaeon]MDG6944538.1 hypothetical protein [Nitrososphaerota archaeon]